MSVEKDVAVLGRFEDLDVRGKIVGEEKGQVEYKFLIGVGGSFVGTGNICSTAGQARVRLRSGRTNRSKEESSC